MAGAYHAPLGTLADFYRMLRTLQVVGEGDEDEGSLHYAFYWGLLFTNDPGLDQRLAAWVRDGGPSLDAMTADHTLVFAVSGSADSGFEREFRPQDVYDIATAL